jgi:hypothetical protein
VFNRGTQYPPQGEYHLPGNLGVLGGHGADVSGVYELSAGETLSIAVGGAGAMGPQDEDEPGGGGGGRKLRQWAGRAIGNRGRRSRRGTQGA